VYHKNSVISFIRTYSQDPMSLVLLVARPEILFTAVQIQISLPCNSNIIGKSSIKCVVDTMSNVKEKKYCSAR